MYRISRGTPGKLITTPLARKGEFHRDDAIEIWLDPNCDSRDSADGARDLYQLVLNSAGDTLNRRLLPAESISQVAGSADAEWKGAWEVEQTVDAEAGLWIFEASLPWSDLNWTPDDVFERSIGVLIARNYQRPAAQRTWFLGRFEEIQRQVSRRLLGFSLLFPGRSLQAVDHL